MCSLDSHSHKLNFPILFVYLLIGVIFLCFFYHFVLSYIFFINKDFQNVLLSLRWERWKTYSNGITTSFPNSILFTKARFFLFSEFVDFQGWKFMSILINLILISTTIVKTLPPMERHDMLKRDSDVSISFYQFWSPHLYIFLMLSRT